MISIKTPEEINIMKQGGAKLATILYEIASIAKSGITTKQLDDLTYNLIKKAGGTPSFLNFQGYKHSSCISINDEVVHGLPSNRTLEDGDIVGIDIGMKYQGFHTDTATTIAIGHIDSKTQNLLSITQNSLAQAIKIAKPGIHLGDIQSEIQKVIEKSGYGIVRDLTGHGIGRELQEAPSIPNYGSVGSGPILKEGMTLAIEPMVNLGTAEVDILSDGWTIVTADNLPSAHFEHTIAITKNGCQILTLK